MRSARWIMTGMADAAFAMADDPKRAETDALARHAVGRFGEPDDIARAAVCRRRMMPLSSPARQSPLMAVS